MTNAGPWSEQTESRNNASDSVLNWVDGSDEYQLSEITSAENDSGIRAVDADHNTTPSAKGMD